MKRFDVYLKLNRNISSDSIIRTRLPKVKRVRIDADNKLIAKRNALNCMLLDKKYYKVYDVVEVKSC